MSEMAPEGGGGGAGNLFTGKIMGIPGVVWLLGAGVLAYFLFFRKSSSSSSTPTEAQTGGSGTITTGNTTIDTGAVQVSVSAPNGGPPGVSVPPRTGGGGPPTSGPVTVPNVVGKSEESAIAMITASGLYPRPANANPGHDPVNSQTPGAGTKTTAGSTVDLGFGKKPS